MLKLVPKYQISFIDYPILNEWCTSLYTIGCPHNCIGCQNEELKNIEYPEYQEFSVRFLLTALKDITQINRSKNICFVGGEPLAPWNIEFIKEFLLNNINYNICIYTGYDINYVKENNIKGFNFLKTGKYIESLKIPAAEKRTRFELGSSNQQLWDNNFNLISINGIYC